MKKSLIVTLICLFVAALSSTVGAAIVFENAADNGFFTPFSSATSSSVRYGDSGWLSAFQPETYTLTGIDLLLAVYDSETAGSTDITFTFNDGDPSGLVFGPGTELYSTTIEDVELQATGAGDVGFFTLSIPLPNIVTSGGFNNIGWSVGVSNFDYAGSFGFAVSTAFGQSVGFYTVNASYYDGSNWSLFSFGGDPNTGVANLTATVYDIPEPGTLSLLALGALGLIRRRAGR